MAMKETKLQVSTNKRNLGLVMGAFNGTTIGEIKRSDFPSVNRWNFHESSAEQCAVCWMSGSL